MSDAKDGEDLNDVPYCQICKVVERQYKCPRCSMLTCSLQCCKMHKDKFSCSGQRDRTAFVSSSSLKEEHLISDYHFLEDVLQTKNTAKRTLLRDCGGGVGQDKATLPNYHQAKQKATTNLFSNARQNLEGYDKKTKTLVLKARERGVNMMLMPNGMSKRTKNTTRFDDAKKALLWKVHLVFVRSGDYSPQDLLRPTMLTDQLHIASEALVSLSTDEVDDTLTIAELVQPYLDPATGNSVERHVLKGLRLHRADLCCMIQRIPSPANNPLFAKISMDTPLGSALKGLTVVEYPTLYVGCDEHMQHFNTLVAAVSDTMLDRSEEPPKKRSRKGKNNKTKDRIPSLSATQTPRLTGSVGVAEGTQSVAVTSAVTSSSSSSSSVDQRVPAGILALVDYGTDDDDNDGFAANDFKLPSDTRTAVADATAVQTHSPEETLAKQPTMMSAATAEGGDLTEEGEILEGEKEAGAGGESDDNDESDEEEEEEDQALFLRQLMELERADIRTLQAIISSAEE